MKDDVWFFYTSGGFKKKTESGYIEELIKKAKELYNLNIRAFNIHKFSIVSDGFKNNLYYDGQLITEYPRCAVVRRYEIYFTRQLELNGVQVINNVQAMIDARNKLKIHQYLSKEGINTPKTAYILPNKRHNNVKYEDVCKLLNSTTFVAKWIYGSQGKHVYLVKNEKKFNSLVEKYKGRVIFQEYIKESFGMDIRAYVIGGKYYGAAIRKSDNDFRSNLALGGEAIKFEYKKEIEELAVKAAKAVNLDICGVDILIGKDKYYVCEVNALPGFKSMARTNNTNEIDVFLELVNNKLNNKE